MKIKVLLLVSFLILVTNVEAQSDGYKERMRRYEALAEKVRLRQFIGGKDEQPLQVQKDLFKPARGSMGTQLETQTSVEETPSTTE